MDPGAAGTLNSAGIALLKQAGENSMLVMAASLMPNNIGYSQSNLRQQPSIALENVVLGRTTASVLRWSRQAAGSQNRGGE